MSSTSKARVLVVDDHELVRKGLSALLSTQWEVCGEAGNGQEAIAEILKLKPDVVLLDLSMPVMSGTAATWQIRQLAPATKIVMISIHDGETIEQLAKAVGADAFVSKSSSPELLHKTIAAVLRPSASQSACAD
jgi:DNA-binding NarL/FixJ family response regulator